MGFFEQILATVIGSVIGGLILAFILKHLDFFKVLISNNIKNIVFYVVCIVINFAISYLVNLFWNYCIHDNPLLVSAMNIITGLIIGIIISIIVFFREFIDILRKINKRITDLENEFEKEIKGLENPRAKITDKEETNKTVSDKGDTMLIHNLKTGAITYEKGKTLEPNGVARVDRAIGEKLMRMYSNGIKEIDD